MLIYFLHYCSYFIEFSHLVISCYFTGLNVHLDHLLMDDHVASSEDTKWLNFKTITCGLLQGYIIKISVVNSNYSHAVSAGSAVWMLDVEIPTPCCISGCKSWIKLIMCERCGTPRNLNGVSGQTCSTGTSSTGFWGGSCPALLHKDPVSVGRSNKEKVKTLVVFECCFIGQRS